MIRRVRPRVISAAAATMLLVGGCATEPLAPGESRITLGAGPIFSRLIITFSGTSLVELTMISRGQQLTCVANMAVGLGCSTGPPG